MKVLKSDKFIPDDKSCATLKTQSTNHSNGTASKGSSEKSLEETTEQSNFSSIFFSPANKHSSKRSVKRCPLNHRELMTSRWVNQIKKKIPAFDVEDATLMNNLRADQRR